MQGSSNCEDSALAWWCRALCFFKASLVLNIIIRVKQFHGACGTSHCAPCNTFGEQRKIYEWIGLFFKPPWKQKSKICLLHSKTERRIHPKTAIFNRPIQGGLAHQKCYARVQPGHSVGRYRAARVAKIITLSPPCACCSVISVGLGRRHDCRITLTISTSPTEDMFQDKKKQCPKIKRFPKISQFQIYHLRLMD